MIRFQDGIDVTHSLEKGDVEFDIDTIKKIMRIIREYAL